MYCNTSIAIHLLRGIGAIVLLVVAFFMASTQPIAIIPALTGAVLLLRGCPLCWVVGLIEKMKSKPIQTPREDNPS